VVIHDTHGTQDETVFGFSFLFPLTVWVIWNGNWKNGGLVGGKRGKKQNALLCTMKA